MRVLIALHKIGPYHHVRLLAATRAGLEISVLETRPQSREYPWDFQASGPFRQTALYGSKDPESDPPHSLLNSQLRVLINCFSPDAIVSMGWADRAYQRLLITAHDRTIPLVIMSDSRTRDHPRNIFKEAIKKQLLRGYSAALVAGKESKAYLESLAFPPSAISQPVDVVDNAFFAARAALVLHSAPAFLCVSRFVHKKNHSGLLQAYAKYQSEGGRWGLRLVGSGPMEDQIRRTIAELPNPSCVEILPFTQLENLGRFYGEARGFVLASTSDQWGLVVNEAMAAGLPCLVSVACGCCIDLIEHGVTGWCFDPSSPQELTTLMHKAEGQSEVACHAMIKAARLRLSHFSPDSFARGLAKAVQHSASNPRFSKRARVVAALLSQL